MKFNVLAQPEMKIDLWIWLDGAADVDLCNEAHDSHVDGWTDVRILHLGAGKDIPSIQAMLCY